VKVSAVWLALTFALPML